jgi:formylglycine-generating enzyme required for sulfatase activity
MGSTATRAEMPTHTVTLNAFWIMQTEVTNAEYKKCVDMVKCKMPNNSRWNDPAYADYPVTDVNWDQASAYANWVGGRLPTEAEWEKAARGTDQRVYPWGNQAPDDRLNYNRGVVSDTMPVGSYPNGASPYGALDMAGNVEEWVADWYSPTYYASSPAQNPQGPDTGADRVLRGGSFLFKPVNARTTARGRTRPGNRQPGVGFRVVSTNF